MRPPPPRPTMRRHIALDSPQKQDDRPQSRAIKLLGAVAAPTTLLAALLYFFGYQQAYHFYDHFGVHHSLLDLSTQYYLLRSVEGMYPPLSWLATATLVALWCYRLLRARLSDSAWRALLRALAPVAAVVGLALVGFALAAVFDPGAVQHLVGLPGVGLAAGVLLLISVPRLRNAARGPSPAGAVAEWIAAFVLVSLGLFWAVGDYSGAAGRSRALDFQARLPALPEVTLFSADGLALPESVPRTPCTDSIYRYRYDGLRLVVQSVPRTDSTRLEFTTTPVRSPHC
jgi:hypothetical protein